MCAYTYTNVYMCVISDSSFRMNEEPLIIKAFSSIIEFHTCMLVTSQAAVLSNSTAAYNDMWCVYEVAYLAGSVMIMSVK